MCHVACHAAEATTGNVKVEPLSAALQKLHDCLLVPLRALIQEDVTNPEYALILTNSFITLGNTTFLGALVNDKTFAPERAILVPATRLLLVRFKHPEVREPPPRLCAVPGCTRIMVFDCLCAFHAAAKYRTLFASPTLSSLLRRPQHFAVFNKWLVQRASTGSAAGSTATLPANLHPRLLSFHRAVEGYALVSSRRLRVSRARVVADKYLAPYGEAHLTLSIATPEAVAAVEASLTRAEAIEAGEDPPSPPLAPVAPSSTAPSTAAGGLSLGLGGGAVPSLDLGSLPTAPAPAPGPMTARMGVGAVSSSLFDTVHSAAMAELERVFASEFVGSPAFTNLVAGVSAAVLASGRSQASAGLAQVADEDALAGMLWTADLGAAEAGQAAVVEAQAAETARETGVDIGEGGGGAAKGAAKK